MRDDAHPDLTPLVGPFGDGPAGAERTELLEHVAACAACREELAGRDPSALFAVLALDPVPASILERLDAGLADRLEASPVRPGRRPLLARFAVAASFVLALGLGTYVVSRGPLPAAGSARLEPARVGARPVVAAEAVPAVELLSSPGSAQVLDLTVGEVDLVMIFDERMRL